MPSKSRIEELQAEYEIASGLERIAREESAAARRKLSAASRTRHEAYKRLYAAKIANAAHDGRAPARTVQGVVGSLDSGKETK